jgi:hypothetical protein
MLLTIAIAVAIWLAVVASVLGVWTLLRGRGEPEYAAAARMHALRRLSPGCPATPARRARPPRRVSARARPLR